MSSPFNDAKVEDVRALRDAAAELDVYIAEWVNGLPEAWSYEAIAHVDAMPDDISRADAFPGDIDVYEDLYVASIWNSYRVARFLVLSIMMDSICWLTSVSKQQQENDYVETLAIIRRLVSEICASVPFHLCCRTSSAALELQYPHSAAASNASNHQPKTRVLGAYFLLSPLKIMLHHCDDTYTYRQWKHKQWSYLSIEQEAWLEGRLATVRSLCVRDC